MEDKCCPVGPGGDHEITNGDEAEILVRTTQGLEVRTEGVQEPGRH